MLCELFCCISCFSVVVGLIFNWVVFGTGAAVGDAIRLVVTICVVVAVVVRVVVFGNDVGLTVVALVVSGAVDVAALDLVVGGHL